MVSIITPSYNSAKYIAATIESVLSQTYQDWEMLIVDDCSTDGSYELIESYSRKDSRIKSFKTQAHVGNPTVPRNIAIENAQGQYIAFLDSDDLWMPGKLKRQLEYFKDSSETAVVFSYYEKISEAGERNNRIVTSPSRITYRQLLKGNVIGSLTGIYDTSKVGKVLLQRIGHEDYLMWLRILKKGYFAQNTNDVQALYRVKGRSFSSNKCKTIKWQWQIYRESEGLNLMYSIYNFGFYAFKAFLKSIK